METSFFVLKVKEDDKRISGNQVKAIVKHNCQLKSPSFSIQFAMHDVLEGRCCHQCIL